MNALLQHIETLKNSTIHIQVEKRIHEFKQINKLSADDLFKELCFCILTANFSAERSIHIHQKLKDCFCTDSQESLSKKLKACGYRFPNTRACYITQSKKTKETIPSIITSKKGEELRVWLVNNVKGLGYKEASHFLRNIGYDDYAIIDFHILDLLQRHNLITQPKTLTSKKYLKIEQILQKVAQQTGLSLAELDLYLWYIETGKVLK